MIFKQFALTVLAFFLISVPSFADHKNTGFIDFNGYYDTRDFNVFTLNISSQLNHGFSYFSLTNYSQTALTPNNLDLNTFYSEQNIKWGHSKLGPFEAAIQYVMRTGLSNDLWRLGVLWKANKTPGIAEWLNKRKIIFFLTAFLGETSFEGYNALIPQIEYVYRFNFLKGNIYLGGFADQNIILNQNQGPTLQWVTEHQLGVKVLENFYAIMEYRYNQFLSSPTGIGLGLEYIIKY